MPASPVHHTPIDKTNAWDGPVAEKAFDKKAGDFVKFYAWVDEGESDKNADGTDKEDGWGPHHDIGASGVPNDANEKGFEAAMAALNGAHGGNSVIPDGDRQAVWDHLAAHYKDAGVDPKDIPVLAARSGSTTGETRDDAPPALPSYSPIPYRVDPGEAVTCPHCQLKNDNDATYCDQCGTELAGRMDVTVAADPTIVADPDDTDTDPPEPTPYAPEPYNPQPDETVQCPDCEKLNDPDAKFCDQCGIELVGRTDVKTNGPVEDVDNVNRSKPRTRAIPAAELVQCQVCQADNDPDASYCDQCGQPIPEEATDVDETDDGPDEGVNDDDDARSRRRAKSPAPKENLIRARIGKGIELRDSADGAPGNGSLMCGHFSVFNQWYEIDSYWEGTFLESVASSAFDRTMVDDRSGMKVLFDHGFDPQMGNKPLGPITVLRADDIGAYYEVPLLDTDYNRDFVLPALQGRLMSGDQVGSQLGASFRFMVLDETWQNNPPPSNFNPQGLPQRTITRAQVLEFGPVTFPASQGASAGVRSLTDEFVNHLHHDPRFVARFTERVGTKVVERMLETTTDRRSLKRNTPVKQQSADGYSTRSQRQRQAQIALALSS